MTPKKLEPEVVSILLPRLSDEFTAFYFYRSAGNWCENAGYKNAAKYFYAESASELEHAKGIEKYLTDYNVTPNLPAIDKPVLKFEGLVDVVNQAYELEYELYENYEKDANKLMKIDICTFALAQKYLAIQLESIAEYSTFLNELELIDKTNKFQVFYWEKETFND